MLASREAGRAIRVRPLVGLGSYRDRGPAAKPSRTRWLLSERKLSLLQNRVSTIGIVWIGVSWQQTRARSSLDSRSEEAHRVKFSGSRLPLAGRIQHVSRRV